MTSFTVNVPFNGQALSVYKALSDVFSNQIFSTERVTRVTDETISFSHSVTFGVFRLLLDGECITADQDFNSRVTLMQVTSKDRGGKGKLNAKLRLSVSQKDDTSLIFCECDLVTKGMLSRVELPIETVIKQKLELLIRNVLQENQSMVIIDDLTEPAKPEQQLAMEVVDLVDENTLSALFESGNIRTSEPTRRSLWLIALKFPAKCITWPINLVRDMIRQLSN